MLVKIALCQLKRKPDPSEIMKTALKIARKSDSDFICLPELFPIVDGLRNLEKDCLISSFALNSLIGFSKEFKGYLIGGSLIEREGGCFYNTCYVIKQGEIVAKYRKINPIKDEIKAGIKPGDKPTIVKTSFGEVGILICADILNEQLVNSVANRSKIIFLPISVTSHHPKVEGHPISTKVAGKHKVVVAKTSLTTGSEGSVKSAVITPNEIIEAETTGDELVEAEVNLIWK